MAGGRRSKTFLTPSQRMWWQRQVWRIQQSGKFVIFVVYLSLFLDNMLLTVVVPIVPDVLYKMEYQEMTLHRKYYNLTRQTLNCSMAPSAEGNCDYQDNNNHTLNWNSSASVFSYEEDVIPEDIISENAKVGLLFSSKALVQLAANPLVGPLTNRIGYTTPLFAGSLILLTSSLLFAFGETFILLFFARSIQGLGSACITIAGMAMVADRYQDDKQRSRIMGFALGGIALGVLVGYPFGGVMYDFVGKTTPLVTVAILLAVDAAIQLIIFRPRFEPERLLIGTSIMKLMRDPYILLTSGAICISTSAIAILEPCLPIWLMEVIAPPRWQLGTVFIPDSLGYFLGTNLFGPVAFRVGRWLTAMLSMLLVGICAIMVPFSTHVLQLAIPHFGLGLGIGITDAALMPLLAHLVDTRYVALYGSVYAIAQVAVSLAYSLGPLLGGQMARSVGFPWLMRGVGILNILYCPLCYFLRNPRPRDEENKAINLKSAPLPDYKTADHTSHAEGRTSYSPFVDEE